MQHTTNLAQRRVREYQFHCVRKLVSSMQLQADFDWLNPQRVLIWSDYATKQAHERRVNAQQLFFGSLVFHFYKILLYVFFNKILAKSGFPREGMKIYTKDERGRLQMNMLNISEEDKEDGTLSGASLNAALSYAAEQGKEEGIMRFLEYHS